MYVTNWIGVFTLSTFDRLRGISCAELRDIFQIATHKITPTTSLFLRLSLSLSLSVSLFSLFFSEVISIRRHIIISLFCGLWENIGVDHARKKREETWEREAKYLLGSITSSLLLFITHSLAQSLTRLLTPSLAHSHWHPPIHTFIIIRELRAVQQGTERVGGKEKIGDTQGWEGVWSSLCPFCVRVKVCVWRGKDNRKEKRERGGRCWQPKGTWRA